MARRPPKLGSGQGLVCASYGLSARQGWRHGELQGRRGGTARPRVTEIVLLLKYCY